MSEMSKLNNVRAFPCEAFGAAGMTLRDYFAAVALQALVTNGRVPSDKHLCAAVSYEYADAMLSERAKD